MWNQANRTMISTSKGTVRVVMKNTRKGHFWAYDETNTFYGPFNSEDGCMSDCITYSEHGTTNDQLIKC